jgi:PhnB protein
MNKTNSKTVLSVMLAVSNTPEAVVWYQKALGARLLWSLGSVAGLEVDGAAFFLHEPVEQRFQSPKNIGTTTARVELFVNDPDSLLSRAMEAGASGGEIRNYDAPWGTHRQGGFVDPFGHTWQIGDKSPLNPFPG